MTTGMVTGNANAGVRQDSNLRRFASAIDPRYIARNDVVELNLEWDFAAGLKLSSLTSYVKDYSSAKQDADSFIPNLGYNNTALSPGGVFVDPQLGATTFNQSYQKVDNRNRQWTQELRIQSDFDGPINFNVGGIYLDYKTTQDFILASTAFTARSEQLNAQGANIYIDPNPDPDGSGHNYLFNRTPYRLKAKAAFGEVYWDATDNLRVTGGLRYTDDDKTSDVIPVALFTPGSGLVTTEVQHARFKELTGRFNVEWNPEISFTDKSMFYASYAKGYKGGGFNPASSVSVGGVQPTYAPEFVNAYEIGTKNTLAGGSVILNLTGFYYDYVDYQVSKVVALTVANENIDATIKGIEFETIVQPVHGLRLNANVGLLDTSIKKGSTSIDLLNRTQGDPSLTFVKNGNGTGCVANTNGIAGLLGGINAGAIPSAALLGVCSGAFASQGIVVSDGIPVDLKGKELPDAPNWTVSLGAEYRYDVNDDWSLTLRGDYYRQGKSYARIYNAEIDRLKGWDNINLSFVAASEKQDFSAQLFVRNLANKTVITSTTTNTELFGMTSQLYLNEPRTYGISLTKSF
ncbi:TonB-dependent receptor domain-containing protein [Novosphingobium sp. RL4]|uniref:TonB-dependent receptor domain-containing protein n=1 Tax=Novosphingobium sp. RL4 TaxID=3109595 RepID=UPI003B63F21E